ncbi:threonine/serine exporter family protein [Clostridium sp.]|uniref:threonine/serine exporter family protein n=1 Tax=Clostridium sp. TaxID=1506 RepID=UPI003464AEF2
MFIETLAAAVGTLAIAIIFNIRGKNLIIASIGGALGWLFYSIFLFYGLTKVSSLFIASLIISIYSEICARVYKTPVTTFIISALIPLVPGGAMYYTMYEAVNGNASTALYMTMDTLASAGTLAFGIIVVSTILKIFLSAKKLIKSTNLKKLIMDFKNK